MEKWRTPVKIVPVCKYNYNDRFLFIGSCFSENISEKLIQTGIRGIVNPTGIMYNPVSIAKTLRLLNQTEILDPSLYVRREGFYFHYDLHSELYATDPQNLQNEIEKQSQRFEKLQLKSKDRKDSNFIVFITLGTAWVHKLKSKNQIIANCQKQEKEQFEKHILSENEIIQSLNEIVAIFPETCEVIFTVSPVRHTREGLHENQVSKSRLLSAVYELVQVNAQAKYFPAYEIMIDELRDYRFYEDDLIHPNKLAVNYIWELFVNNYLDDQTKQMLYEWKKLCKMKQHRSLIPESQESVNFKRGLSEKITAFYKKYDGLDKETRSNILMR